VALSPFETMWRAHGAPTLSQVGRRTLMTRVVCTVRSRSDSPTPARPSRNRSMRAVRRTARSDKSPVEPPLARRDSLCTQACVGSRLDVLDLRTQRRSQQVPRLPAHVTTVEARLPNSCQSLGLRAPEVGRPAKQRRSGEPPCTQPLSISRHLLMVSSGPGRERMPQEPDQRRNLSCSQPLW
jgi:hypothetical protein